MEPGGPPDLRDVEQKLGRKVPESLARPLRGEEHPGRAAAATEPARGSAAAPGPRRRRAAALARLETKLHLLRQEMVSARGPPGGDGVAPRSRSPAGSGRSDGHGAAPPPPRAAPAACRRRVAGGTRRASALEARPGARGLGLRTWVCGGLPGCGRTPRNHCAVVLRQAPIYNVAERISVTRLNFGTSDLLAVLKQVLALRCVLLSSRSFVSQWCHKIATFKAKLKEPLRSLQANEQPSKNIERLVGSILTMPILPQFLLDCNCAQFQKNLLLFFFLAAALSTVLVDNLLGQTPYYFPVGMRILLAACGGGFMQLSWNSAIQSEQSNLILCKQVQCYTIVPVPVQPHVYISKRSVGGWESSERISRLGGKENQK